MFYATTTQAVSPDIETDLAAAIPFVETRLRQLQLGAPIAPKLTAPGFDQAIAAPFAGVEQDHRLHITGEFYLVLNSATGEEVFAFAYSARPGDLTHINKDVTGMLAGV